MKALIKYSLHDYIRSHKYFPPVSTFFIFIIVFYTYKPNPVMDSYAVTALILYVISAWLCISIFSLEQHVQRQMMILHMKSGNRYYLSKLILVWLVTMVLTVYAFVYPIVFDMFREPVTLSTGIVSLANHILLATLGVCVGSLFSKGVMDNLANSYGGLSLTVIISIAALGIYDVLPSTFKNIVWILPPSVITQTPLNDWSGESISELSVFPFVWIIIYSFLLVMLFLKLARRN